jgi:hypothetical protein
MVSGCEKFNITVYGKVTIDINNKYERPDLTVDTHNLTGALVFRQHLSSQPSGLYLISLIDSNERPLGVKKIIKTIR